MQLLFRLISVVGAAFVGATFNQGTFQSKEFGAFFFFFFFFFFFYFNRKDCSSGENVGSISWTEGPTW